MARIYGYVRVSTNKQNPERQINNIHQQYPEAVISIEKYTGTKLDRPCWNKLYKAVKPGDTVVFDEVSRLARNAAEGFEVYRNLYDAGVELVFLKDHAIDTAVFRDAMNAQVQTVNTGNADNDFLVNGIMEFSY